MEDILTRASAAPEGEEPEEPGNLPSFQQSESSVQSGTGEAGHAIRFLKSLGEVPHKAKEALVTLRDALSSRNSIRENYLGKYRTPTLSLLFTGAAMAFFSTGGLGEGDWLRAGSGLAYTLVAFAAALVPQRGNAPTTGETTGQRLHEIVTQPKQFTMKLYQITAALCGYGVAVANITKGIAEDSVLPLIAGIVGAAIVNTSFIHSALSKSAGIDRAIAALPAESLSKEAGKENIVFKQSESKIVGGLKRAVELAKFGSQASPTMMIGRGAALVVPSTYVLEAIVGIAEGEAVMPNVNIGVSGLIIGAVVLANLNAYLTTQHQGAIEARDRLNGVEPGQTGQPPSIPKQRDGKTETPPQEHATHRNPIDVIRNLIQRGRRSPSEETRGTDESPPPPGMAR